MTANLDQQHPLIHQGTNQRQRQLAALLPESIALQQHDTADLLNYAYELAEVFTFFNAQGQEGGNWQCFFSDSSLGMLAIISSLDLQAIDEQYCLLEATFWRELEKAVAADDPVLQEKVRREHYQHLINEIYHLAQKILQLCDHLPSGLALKQEIIHFIEEDIVNAVYENKVQNALVKLIAYDKGSPAFGHAAESGTTEQKYKAFIAYRDTAPACSKVWGIADSYAYDCIPPEDGYKEEAKDKDCRENTHLRALFLIFFQVISKTVQRAEFHLQQELQNQHAQQPHISLFVAFIQLFKRLQTQFNELTALHLQYYYREVLGLEYNSFTADQLYVVFELAENFTSFPLPEGTMLDALKDSDGNPMQYKLLRELIVDRATVEKTAMLKLEAVSKKGYTTLKANELEKETVANWTNSAKSTADLGFVITDPILKMAEGNRFLTVRLDLFLRSKKLYELLKSNNLIPYVQFQEGTSGKTELLQGVDLSGLFKVSLSTPETDDGWLAVAEYQKTDKLEYNNDGTPVKVRPALYFPPPEADEARKGTTSNDYSLAEKGGFSAFCSEKDKVEIRILLKKDDLPIALPPEEGEWYGRSKAPLLKVEFQQGHELFSTFLDRGLKKQLLLENVELLQEVDEVQRELEFRNEYGRFHNGEPFALLGEGRPTVLDDKSVQLRIPNNAFLEVQAKETIAKNLLGLAFAEKEASFVGDDPLMINKEFYDQFKIEFRQVNTVLSKEAPNRPKLPGELPTITGNSAAELFSESLLDIWGRRTEIFGDNLPGGAAEDFDTLKKLLDEQLVNQVNIPFDGVPKTVEVPLRSLLVEGEVLEDDEFETILVFVLQLWRAYLKLNPSAASADYGWTEVLGKGKPTTARWITTAAELITSRKRETTIAKAIGEALAAEAPQSTPPRYQQSDRNQNIFSLQLQAAAALAAIAGEAKPEAVGEVAVSNAAEAVRKPQRVKNLPIRYAATAKQRWERLDAERDEFKRDFFIYYITPFGFHPLAWPQLRPYTAPLVKRELLLPSGSVLATDAPSLSVSYLLGCANLTPGGTLSLLFKVREGSGNTEVDPPNVHWAYLKGIDAGNAEQWAPISAERIVFDTTKADPRTGNSLLQTGIVTLNIPADILPQSTSHWPNQPLYWIAATAMEDDPVPAVVAALPEITNVYAQAALAEWQNKGNTLDHLTAGLPAETIQKLLQPKEAIKKVQQPDPSFDGRPEEEEQSFYQRVSERLRHKERAVTLWDFERLLLEAFPEVNHVKCINHSNRDSVLAPGRVMLAVFPNVKEQNAMLAVTPGFGVGQLEKMERFLGIRTNLYLSCGENLQVVNPIYELLKVECCVKFYRDRSPAYYREELRKDLAQFLAPWLANNEHIPLFRASLHWSIVLNFIEERDYVDKVRDFKLYRVDEAGNSLETTEDSWKDIKAASARSLFTTFYEERDGKLSYPHDIRLWDTECPKALPTEYIDSDPCMDT